MLTRLAKLLNWVDRLRLRTSRAAVLVGLVVGMCHAAHAQSSGAVWSPIGPAGGTVTALLTLPASPATLYAGTPENGVFLSNDGGATWSPANTGLPATTAFGRQTLFAVYALVADDTYVYAATASGLFFTAIAAAPAWQAMASTGAASPLTLLAIDPNTKRLFAAGGSPGLAAPAVFVASVGSASGPLSPWSASSLPAPTSGSTIGSLAIIPSAAGTQAAASLLAGVGGGVFAASVDVATASLSWVNVDPASVLSASPISFVHYSPDFLIAYACNAGAVFYSGNPLDPQVVWLPATVPASGSTAFTCNSIVTVPAASGAAPQVVLGTDQGVFASVDGVHFTSGGTTGRVSSVNAIAVGRDPSTSIAAVFAGTGFGVFKTGADTLVAQPSWAASNGPSSVASGSGGQRLNNANIVDVAVLGTTLYGAAVTDQYVEVFASADGGATWRATSIGDVLASGEQVVSLAADSAHATLYAATTQGLLSYSSTSDRWSAVGASTIVGRVGALQVGTSSLFVGTDAGLYAIALSSSPSSAVPIAAGLSGASVRALHAAGGSIYAGTINPDDTNVVFSAPESGVASGTAIWTAFGVGTAGTDRITSLLLVGSNLLAATNGSLILYASQGSAWASANTNPNVAQQISDTFGAVNGLFTDGVSIYASTGSNGVFVSPAGGAFSWTPLTGSAGGTLPSLEVHTLRASGSTLYASTRGGIATYSGISDGTTVVATNPAPSNSGGGAVDVVFMLWLVLAIAAIGRQRQRPAEGPPTPPSEVNWP